MDSLRWWFLLLAAVMFSMSGCASKDQWNAWTAHPSHYASGNHWEFSQRTGGNIDPQDHQRGGPRSGDEGGLVGRPRAAGAAG